MNPAEAPKSPEAADGGVKGHSASCERCRRFIEWADSVDWAAESERRKTGLPAEVYRVLMMAYDWTINEETGEIWGLTAGDQGYEESGVYLRCVESAKSVPHASVSGETQTADPQDSQKS